MIPVDSLLYKIDQRLNKLSTNTHQQIALEDKLLALNEAQVKLIKQKLDGISTVSRMGMDAFKKRYEDLQSLIEDYSDHVLELSLKDAHLNQWSASVKELDPPYMFYVDSYILCNKGRCKDRKVWVNKDLTKHGDIQFLLNNEHFCPSFEYQETFNSISTDNISVFTDGSFTPTRMYLMYVRYPKKIDKSGYTNFDESESSDCDCELASFLEDELLDLTVQNLAMYTENVAAVQSAQFRIQTNE